MAWGIPWANDDTVEYLAQQPWLLILGILGAFRAQAELERPSESYSYGRHYADQSLPYHVIQTRRNSSHKNTRHDTDLQREAFPINLRATSGLKRMLGSWQIRELSGGYTKDDE